MAQLNSTTISGVLGISSGVTGTFASFGDVQLHADAAGTVPVSVSGYTGQVANLQNWSDNVGNILMLIDSAGNISGSAGTSAIIENISAASFSFPGQGQTLRISGAGNNYLKIENLDDGGIANITVQNNYISFETPNDEYDVWIGGWNPGMYVYGSGGAANAHRVQLYAAELEIWSATGGIQYASFTSAVSLEIYGDLDVTGNVSAADMSASNDIIAENEIYTSGGVVNFPSGWTIEYNDSASSLDFVYTSG